MIVCTYNDSVVGGILRGKLTMVGPMQVTVSPKVPLTQLQAIGQEAPAFFVARIPKSPKATVKITNLPISFQSYHSR